MERLYAHPESNMTSDDWNFQRVDKLFKSGTILTQKPTQEVKLCLDEETPYIIKKYITKSLLGSLREWLGKARSDKSFESAITLQALSIPVPMHHMIAKQLAFSQSVSYLLMDKAQGTPLIEFLLSENFGDLPENSEQHIIDIVDTLHKAGIAHGDLHTRNLIIADDGTVSLIDLDNVEKSPGRIPRDVRRLHQALIDHPGPLHKLQKYLEARLDATLGKH